MQMNSESWGGLDINEYLMTPSSRKHRLELLPLTSETSFTELYAKPSRAPTLICLPCCAILACSKVETWSKFCNSDEFLN